MPLNCEMILSQSSALFSPDMCVTGTCTLGEANAASDRRPGAQHDRSACTAKYEHRLLSLSELPRTTRRRARPRVSKC